EHDPRRVDDARAEIGPLSGEAQWPTGRLVDAADGHPLAGLDHALNDHAWPIREARVATQLRQEVSRIEDELIGAAVHAQAAIHTGVGGNGQSRPPNVDAGDLERITMERRAGEERARLAARSERGRGGAVEGPSVGEVVRTGTGVDVRKHGGVVRG